MGCVRISCWPKRSLDGSEQRPSQLDIGKKRRLERLLLAELLPACFRRSMRRGGWFVIRRCDFK